MASIGFIGLGNMGGPMAANLVKAGHGVRGFDVVAEARAAAEAAGIALAADAADAARDAGTIITMLPAGEHVRKVYLGLGGVLAAARPGTLLIDCSTIDIDTARATHEAAAKSGFAMLDAPVSGGVAGAVAATLTFMCGGAEAAFERARPILAAMGKTVVHAGGPGSGQAAKICNNMILGVSMIAVCEAFALAERLGLDKHKLFEISGKSSGQCWSLTSYCPVPGPLPSSPANRDYKPGFTADMMLKDLRLAQDAAAGAGVQTALGAQAAAIFARFSEAGQGSLDFSGIFKLVSGKL